MPTLDELAQAGIAAINDKRFDEAITAFQGALALEPERPDMNNALGMAHLHRGDAGSAVPWLEKAVQLAEPVEGHDEMKRHFHGGLASAYQLLDRVLDARRVLEGVVAKWPEDTDAILQLGQLLLSSCQLDDGVEVYRGALERFDDDTTEVIEAVVGSIDAFMGSEHEADVFLRGHQESYRDYFNQVAVAQVEKGWFAEAARMARGADGEPVAIVAEGARPYALSRVDLVNPEDGTVSSIYSEQEPMVVALNGFEPLGQLDVVLPWKSSDFPFEVGVTSRCPWHWLTVHFQFREPGTPEALIERIDGTVGDWYLMGFNGEFGEQESGRFHYVTDPEIIGDRAVSYTFDLGRARFEAIGVLLRRLVVLHDRQPLERVVFGNGRLPT